MSVSNFLVKHEFYDSKYGVMQLNLVDKVIHDLEDVEPYAKFLPNITLDSHIILDALHVVREYKSKLSGKDSKADDNTSDEL